MNPRILKAWPAILVLALLTHTAVAETADDVIARNIAARGGIEKIESLKSIRMAGKLVVGNGVMEGQIVSEVKRPTASRVDFSFGAMEGFRVFDGTTGWGTTPWAGINEPAVLKGNELKDAQEESDIEGPLVHYKDKGHKVELVGKDKWGETDCDKLKVTLKNGDVTEVYIDSKTHLEAGYRMFRDGEPYVESTLSDFKEEEGLMMPHKVDVVPQIQTDMATHVIIEHVEINPELDEARFARPENLPATPTTKP